MNEKSGKPRIFLCHASEDKPRVRELYHQLKGAGYHPWLDKEDLLPGQDWRHEIEKIIRDPYNVVVVCLSYNSVTKRGVVQQEIKWALDVLDQTPEGTIYLIPARLENCPVPDRLSKLHWVNLFETDGFDKLKQALDSEIGKRSTNEGAEGQKQFLEALKELEELKDISSEYFCPYCRAPLVAKEIQPTYGEYDDGVLVVRYDCGYTTEDGFERSPCPNKNHSKRKN